MAVIPINSKCMTPEVLASKLDWSEMKSCMVIGISEDEIFHIAHSTMHISDMSLLSDKLKMYVLEAIKSGLDDPKKRL